MQLPKELDIREGHNYLGKATAKATRVHENLESRIEGR